MARGDGAQETLRVLAVIDAALIEYDGRAQKDEQPGGSRPVGDDPANPETTKDAHRP